MPLLWSMAYQHGRAASFSQPTSALGATYSYSNSTPPPGLYPNDSSVARRPPLIPESIEARKNTKNRDGTAAKDVNRWVQAVKLVGSYVKHHNQIHVQDPCMQYRWFDTNRVDSDISNELYGIVQDTARSMIQDIYGKLTYNEAMQRHGSRMEEFVRAVAQNSAFDPLTQTARLFGIRAIISSKMNTRRRSNLARQKKESQARKNATSQMLVSLTESTEPMTKRPVSLHPHLDQNSHLAPSVVPDLPSHEPKLSDRNHGLTTSISKPTRHVNKHCESICMPIANGDNPIRPKPRNTHACDDDENQFLVTRSNVAHHDNPSVPLSPKFTTTGFRAITVSPSRSLKHTTSKSDDDIIEPLPRKKPKHSAPRAEAKPGPVRRNPLSSKMHRKGDQTGKAMKSDSLKSRKGNDQQKRKSGQVQQKMKKNVDLMFESSSEESSDENCTDEEVLQEEFKRWMKLRRKSKRKAAASDDSPQKRRRM